MGSYIQTLVKFGVYQQLTTKQTAMLGLTIAKGAFACHAFMSTDIPRQLLKAEKIWIKVQDLSAKSLQAIFLTSFCCQIANKSAGETRPSKSIVSKSASRNYTRKRKWNFPMNSQNNNSKIIETIEDSFKGQKELENVYSQGNKIENKHGTTAGD